MSPLSFGRALAATTLASGLAAMAGCQSSTPLESGNSSASVVAMERVMKSATACWYAAGDSDFKPYRLAPELDAIAGPPRLLIVPASAPQGRPLAVVEAHGASAQVVTYGPLMARPVGKRIASDVQRWAGGNASCGGAA